MIRETIERLEAIAALGEFGAGYELAKRDLEIRGGGELVGVAQHGNLGRVGFQRYCDLLEEAVRKVKGDTRERTQVEVSMPSAIPSDYLPHENLRVALYRKLLWTRDVTTLDALYEETLDRFGPIPRTLRFLFDVARLRVIGPDHGILKVLCASEKNSAQCLHDSPLLKRLPPKGWFKRGLEFMGPGGIDAFATFIRHIMVK